MRTNETPTAGERSPGDSPNRAHRVSFSFAISCISRFMILRDRALGWTKRGRVPTGIHERASRHAIPSAAHVLDAVFVEPVRIPAHAAILLCHGIGETVEQWFGVQQLLAANGVASLVFDYSGYGKSTGKPHWEQFELDAIAAFAALEKLAPKLPVSVLGFSLGTGVATATIDRLAAHRLILCEAFTSFRGATVSIGIPRRAFPSRAAHLACASAARAVQAAGPDRSWREGPALSRRDGARTGRLVRAASGGRSRPQYHPQPALPQAAPFLLGPDHRMDAQGVPPVS